MIKKNKIIISGVSGSGKTTLLEYLLLKYNFTFARSFTTRKKRFEHESEYEFVSVLEFEYLKNQGFFFEFEYLFGNYYGTPKSYLELNNVIFNVDVKGMQKLKEKIDCKTIFITPPSKDILKERLIQRKENNIEDRLAKFDYEESFKHLYDFVIINDKLENSYTQIDNIMEII
jgi:guanylate kinase